MCGIVAVWSPGAGLSAGDLAGAVAMLDHRGPDGSGVWCSPTGRAALGHTRLAIIDLETGHQPIGAEDGRRQVVVSGEFYGYEAIRRELAGRGRILSTRSDSEIAVHLLALEGRRALTRLRGEFALVYWDETRAELLAARDRFGIKPLYFAEHAGRLYLASEIKVLLRLGVPARWDIDAFTDHLQTSVAPDRTLFAGVQQIPPGCLLMAGPAGWRVERYWDLDYPRVGSGPPMGTWADQTYAIRQALEEAVRLRTRADVPVGCHLSGGLDSTSVVAIAASAGPTTTFTVRFDEAGYDEGEVARRSVTALGVRHHHEITCPSGQLLSHLPATIRAGEMVQENAHGVARYLHSAGIKACGFKVVLGGEGGDEIFTGYPQFQRDLALTLSESARARAVAGYAKLDEVGMPAHLRSLRDRLGLVPSWIVDRYATVTAPIRSLLRDDAAARLRTRDSVAPLLAGSADQLDGRTFIHQSLYLFIRTWLCNYLLVAERLDMAHAVEVRLPYLDHRLFEVVRDVPVERYAAPGRSKLPLRAAMADALPAEVTSRQKQGFFAPPLVSDDQSLAALRELTLTRSLQDSPFFDAHKVSQEFDRIGGLPPAQRRGAERLLQIVAATGVLASEFGLSAP